MGIDHFPRVAESTQTDSPLAMGIWRPLVILPMGLSRTLDRSQLEAILIHEGAHIRGRDPFVLFAQQMLRAVYWLHPLSVDGERVDLRYRHLA